MRGKWIPIILLSLIISIGVSYLVSAQDNLYVYVHNRPYKGQIEVYGNRVYLELMPLLELMKLKYAVEGGVVYIVTDDNQLVPVEHPVRKVYINSKPFENAYTKGSKIFVDLQKFCSLVGYRMVYNRETGMIDVVSANRRILSKARAEALLKVKTAQERQESVEKKSPEEVEQGKETGSGSEEQSGQEVQSGKESKRITASEKEKAEEELKIPADAVIVTDVYKYMDTRPGPNAEVRVSAKVKNKWKKIVKKVRVTLQIVDGYGKPLVSKTYFYPSLKPGEVKEINFLWYNYTNIPVDVKFTVNFEGKPTGKGISQSTSKKR